MADPALLEIADLSFRYRRASEPALRNLSLRLSGQSQHYLLPFLVGS